MVKLTVYVTEETAERVRNAVAHLAGAPLFLTMSAFGEEALRNAVEELEKKNNAGRPFDRPTGARRPGRPPGT